MKTTLNWLGGAAFRGETGSGHQLVLDGPPEGGGENRGPRPMETLLLGMGACTAYDVLSILRKSRRRVDGCTVEVAAQRADDHPKVFTEIRVHFVFTGADVTDAQVERAIRLSAEKYCSASIMLGKTAKLTHTYEMRPAADAATPA